jgi:hypothetical protein
LSRDELDALNLIVSAYLDFAELQARSHKPMHMADWIAKLDDFLRLSDRDILSHAGRISHHDAEQHAVAQYERFDHQRRQIAAGTDSDFDRAVKRLTEEPTPPKPRGRKKKRDDTSGGDE